ncbi:MraY family glycosyltransferase [Ramlibacter alkalitolerans]|uniref:Glycosyltransferase family 4 protein n=1 Tax=Ramlibacter alkalitolerans TaxID=2039631 RepID=A0ABS1JWU2_9BURK|nr:glycosyltransferase family 4 protein [Ramlibacter alkalitolerans]
MTLTLSYVIAQALVLSAHKHGHLTMDLPGAVQKFHLDPTPRVGGIAIYIAITAAWIVLPGASEAKLLGTALLAGMPALLVGLVEDVTKRVSVRARLLVTMGSGGLAALWSGYGINRLDIPLADSMLAFWPFAILFTAFAVGGVANAINIIDGFHGLASGTLMISLVALATIAYSVGDVPLATVALVVGAGVAGFWVVNFPWGRLFLGDGGAYFSGFTLAWLTVELLARNPRVSPWASVLLCAYPTVEVIYSIIRRSRQRRSPGAADRHHLHSLVATQIVQPRMRGAHPNLRNAAVSVVMWICALVPVLPAIFFYNRADILLPSLAGCFLAYHVFYRRVATMADRSSAEVPAEDAADATT